MFALKEEVETWRLGKTDEEWTKTAPPSTSAKLFANEQNRMMADLTSNCKAPPEPLTELFEKEDWANVAVSEGPLKAIAAPVSALLLRNLHL
jgi:hypothetical protein